MTVLAIESSTRLVTSAVQRGGELVEVQDDGRPVEGLHDLVTRTLREAGVAARDLEGIVVGGGPGSVVGVRSGVSFANALSYAVGCPIRTVGGLDSIAHAAGGGDLVVAIDAGRGRLYVARYRNGEREARPELVEEADAPEGVLRHRLPRAGEHLALAAEAPHLAVGGGVASARPLDLQRPA
ncbi:MAG TPA: tRNA (adenosine(37)-N6)-threonylcarbamoyltransferase complex dimerization subunit type 1 TsaB [Solirubrobacteraceae bacterium]